jgi:hypothetical protein
MAIATSALAHSPAIAVRAGSSPAPACSDQATVSYQTHYSATSSGYVVTRAPIKAGKACAEHRFELTLSDAYGDRAMMQGMLDQHGTATPHVVGSDIDAATVAVALVVTTGGSSMRSK